MDNKKHTDLTWKDVPAGKKKKFALRAFIIALCAVIVGLLICWIIGEFRTYVRETVDQLTQAEEPDLNGIGLDDIMSWGTPEGYGEGIETESKSKELIGMEWSDEDSMISICMQTYKGECVMGFEEGNIDSYIKEERYNLEPVNIGENGEVKAYISAEPVSGKAIKDEPAEDWNPPADSHRLEAAFQYGEHVISVCLEKYRFSEDGSASDFSGALTDKQIESFYSTLRSISFHDIDGE